MRDQYFFGYGSLVNRLTHDYPSFKTARVKGWQRIWQPSPFRPVAFLSVVPAIDEWLVGAIAKVPNADWAALDERERAYIRRPVNDTHAEHDVEGADLHIYAVENPVAPNPAQPILLSYIDVVAQGFMAEHGEEGVYDFFKTTKGWEVPVKNDRQAPLYPRSQNVTVKERDLVDRLLRDLTTVVD